MTIFPGPDARGDGSVVVPVAFVRGVPVALVDVVHMPLVRYGDVAAALAVLVVMPLMSDVVGVRTLVDVTVVGAMQVTVVRVVGVVVMRYGDVAAALAMSVLVVLVLAVRDAGGHVELLMSWSCLRYSQTMHSDINT